MNYFLYVLLCLGATYIQGAEYPLKEKASRPSTRKLSKKSKSFSSTSQKDLKESLQKKSKEEKPYDEASKDLTEAIAKAASAEVDVRTYRFEKSTEKEKKASEEYQKFKSEANEALKRLIKEAYNYYQSNPNPSLLGEVTASAEKLKSFIEDVEGKSALKGKLLENPAKNLRLIFKGKDKVIKP